MACLGLIGKREFRHLLGSLLGCSVLSVPASRWTTSPSTPTASKTWPPSSQTPRPPLLNNPPPPPAHSLLVATVQLPQRPSSAGALATVAWSFPGASILPGTSGTKHTGERPFACHCSKQFSRLDNLRQHAQTVHADKQEQNERMMQELTSLHASMTAASKGGSARGKRAAAQQAAQPSSSALDGSQPSMAIKQEDTMVSMHPRPGTSTGYEDGNNMYWSDRRASHSFRGFREQPSFRDPGQSFRAPADAVLPQQQLEQQHPGQSFRIPAASSFNFSLPDIGNPPPASALRPRTGSNPRPPSPSRALPPISAIVPSSLPPALPLPHQPPPLLVPGQQPPLTSSHILPLPTPSAHARRPSTASRPGTAPASFYYASPNAFPPGSGSLQSAALVGAPARPDLSLSFLSGHHGRYDSSLLRSTAAAAGDQPAPEPTSPNSYESPFSFQPPAVADPPVPANPRKRPYDVVDDDDSRYGRPDAARPLSSGRRPGTAGTALAPEYDYGSESRPQSRRLSVMELCNDTDADPAARPFIPLSAAAGPSRPTTSSGLVTSASQLALVDR
ncbi:hypothetical protein K474DRAFT_1726660, partial [Panus rudis PR-1116 ss-1]